MIFGVRCSHLKPNMAIARLRSLRIGFKRFESLESLGKPNSGRKLPNASTISIQFVTLADEIRPTRRRAHLLVRPRQGTRRRNPDLYLTIRLASPTRQQRSGYCANPDRGAGIVRQFGSVRTTSAFRISPPRADSLRTAICDDGRLARSSMNDCWAGFGPPYGYRLERGMLTPI